MDFFLFAYNILTAYLFGYAVFFIVSLVFKNHRLINFVDFSETKIPVVGLLISIILIVALFFIFYFDYYSNGYTSYSFPGQKVLLSYYQYVFLSILYFIVPTQLFRNYKVKNSIIFKAILILFFIIEFDWFLIEIEEFLKLRGPKAYYSYFSLGFYFRIFKMLIVYIVLNFILIKFFNRNAKPQL